MSSVERRVMEECLTEHTHPCVSDGLIAACANQGNHSQTVGDKFVGQDGGVDFNFDHVDC